MDKQEKIDFCRKWIQKLDDQFRTLQSERREALQFCNGDPTIVALITGRSQIVTTDMLDAIDMAKPDILENIAGVDEPLKLDPSSGEDVEPVKKLQILGNVMLKRKNPWFRLCNDFLEDSMKLKFGAFKYQWFKDDKAYEKDYEDLTDDEIDALLINPKAELVYDSVMMPNGRDITEPRLTTIKYNVSDEYVKIDCVPSERIRFPLDTDDFCKAAFVWEEVMLYKHEFIKQYGRKIFDKVEETKNGLMNDTPDQVLQERFADVGGLNFMYDTEEDKYRVNECYFPREEDSEPWLFVFIGDEVLIDEKNKYGKPPYRGGSPFMLAHRLLGAGYIDYLRETQRQRTFIKRQIFDNCAQANFRRNFGDPERINLDDYFNNNTTNSLVRVQGDPRTVIMGEEKAPLPPELLNFWEMMQVEKDMHIPTPRQYSGLNAPSSQDRTYRGQKLKVDQASKKLLMMLRGYMEDVFGPLFGDVLDCIMMFMQKSTSIRYLNEDYEVTPDNIIGRYDLIVNVGLGSHDKTEMVAKLQQLIGLASREMQNGSGIITADNMHYIFSELVKAMGFLNTHDFVTDPKIKEMVMQLIGIIIQIPELEQQAGPLVQQIMAAYGVQLANPSGGAAQGSFPGENMASQPQLPMEALNPRTTPDGGGFYG